MLRFFRLKNAQRCPPLAANVVAALRGRGLTKVRAGYTLENQHKSSSGHTPPLSQNRSLYAVFSN